jgi:hypothetical protein
MCPDFTDADQDREITSEWINGIDPHIDFTTGTNYTLPDLDEDDDIMTTLFSSSGKATKITKEDLAQMIEMLEGLHVLEAEEPEDLLALTSKASTIKIALDSGACDHVANREDLRGFRIRETAASRAGRGYIAANGEKVPNEGECDLALKDTSTGVEFDSLFQLAPVSRPLFSVGRICDRGCEVNFTNVKATVSKEGRKIAVFERQPGGLYVANVEIKGDGDSASTFVGQGVRS